MGKLSIKMRKIMEMRNFSENTTSTYLLQMKQFVEYHNISPERLAEDDIIEYLYYLRKEKQASCSTIHVAYCVIKFFYLSVLSKELDFKRIPFPKLDKKLPVVLAKEEVKAILDVIDNIKHKTIVMTAYSTGLRLSEIRNLQPGDIDSKRMQIHIQRGKGKKDRYTLLAHSLLEQLRQYYKTERPKRWLFPGQYQNKPLCSMTVQRIFNIAKKKPVLQNPLPFIL